MERVCRNCIHKAVKVANGRLFCKHLMDSIGIGKAMGENHSLAWESLLKVPGVVPAAKHHVSMFLEDAEAIADLNSRMSKGRACVSRYTVSEWVWMPPPERVLPPEPTLKRKSPKIQRRLTSPIVQGREVPCSCCDERTSFVPGTLDRVPFAGTVPDREETAEATQGRREVDPSAAVRPDSAPCAARSGTVETSFAALRPIRPACRQVRESEGAAGEAGMHHAVVRGHRRLPEVWLDDHFFDDLGFLGAGAFLDAGDFLGAVVFVPPTCARLRPRVLRGTGSDVASVLVILSMLTTTVEFRGACNISLLLCGRGLLRRRLLRGGLLRRRFLRRRCLLLAAHLRAVEAGVVVHRGQVVHDHGALLQDTSHKKGRSA